MKINKRLVMLASPILFFIMLIQCIVWFPKPYDPSEPADLRHKRIGYVPHRECNNALPESERVIKIRYQNGMLNIPCLYVDTTGGRMGSVQVFFYWPSMEPFQKSKGTKPENKIDLRLYYDKGETEFLSEIDRFREYEKSKKLTSYAAPHPSLRGYLHPPSEGFLVSNKLWPKAYESWPIVITCSYGNSVANKNCRVTMKFKNELVLHARFKEHVLVDAPRFFEEIEKLVLSFEVLAP